MCWEGFDLKIFCKCDKVQYVYWGHWHKHRTEKQWVYQTNFTRHIDGKFEEQGSGGKGITIKTVTFLIQYLVSIWPNSEI